MKRFLSAQNYIDHVTANYFSAPKEVSHDQQAEEIESWMHKNIRGSVFQYQKKYWFEFDDDRVKFILKWIE